VIVYVWGNLTTDNFTSRPGKDTLGRAGQKPGLSAFDAPPDGRKAQGLDLNLLTPPLKAFPDDTDRGGTKGHVAIAPVDYAGEVDATALDDWASYRGTGQTHPFTRALLDKAVVRPNFWSEK
jgi:hypothetical protein